ncbi:hypothetical protein SAMN02927937_00546 [Paenimyroides aquimaris]|uniref:Uncharacterized protein n=2 Tax=Paenimyroides marinum TaxID=1159016 RepID=A0A1H6JIW8_9FLAO|nr:hypothetical protein SAMN02927937_00546 [Paenimyroides aquimaris]
MYFAIKMKVQLTIFFFLLIISNANSQERDCREDYLIIDCNEESVSWSYIVYKGEKINYKVAYRSPVVSRAINGKCKFYGKIIVPINRSEYKKKDVKNILKTINEELDFEYFIAYSTCEAIRVSMTAYHHKLKTKFLKDNQIGFYKKE